MPKVFKTSEDNNERIELVGVGVAGSNGRGGIPVEDAAEKMGELQGAGGVPLASKALEEAAKAFAEERGLEVVNVSKKEVEGLAQEWGNAPDPPPAGQAAEEEYDRVFGPGEEVPDEGAPEPAAGDGNGAAVSGSQSTED